MIFYGKVLSSQNRKNVWENPQSEDTKTFRDRCLRENNSFATANTLHTSFLIEMKINISI